MIEITQVDHVSMAAPDWKSQAERLERLLGFRLLFDFPGRDPDGFNGCSTQVPGTDIEFEIISPMSERNFLHRFLAEDGPGLHHIAVEVPDIQAAADELRRLGVEPLGGIQDDGAWHITFIHPRDSGGILWQLFVPHSWPAVADRSTGSGVAGIRRMDHVSMGVPDIDWQIEFQQRVFGFELEGRWHNEHDGYYGAIMTMPNSQAKFEIIQPSRGESFVQRFLDRRRAGMHHICLEVESVDRAAEALRAGDIEPYGGVIESDWRRHTFLHPRDSGGVLFQLFEEPAER